MKKVLLITIYILTLSGSISHAQIGTLIQMIDSSCSTGECEVVVRQYTGVINAYGVSVRCLEGGGYGEWHVSEYSGIYPGSALSWSNISIITRLCIRQ